MSSDDTFQVPVKMHVSLNVTSVERALPFYEALFGQAPAKVRCGYANFDLANPPLKFALSECPHQELGALNHLGFQVPESADVEAIKTRFQQAGLATFDEKDTTCCYARQDKIWLHDPDGHPWEVYALIEHTEEAGMTRIPLPNGGECCVPSGQAQAAAETAGMRCCG
jgi:catechol 2,3-dioxygenase-like lactoylglutathione lyase family enzyme